MRGAAYGSSASDSTAPRLSARVKTCKLSENRHRRFNVCNNLDRLEECLGFLEAALDAEGDHAAEACRLALGHLVVWVRRQAWVHDLIHLWVDLKVSSNSHGVLGMSFHAKVECLEATVDEEAIKG